MNTQEWARRFAILLSAILVAGAGRGQVSSRPASPGTVDLAAIVSQMEQAQAENRERTRAYVMTRDYRLYGADESRPTSQIRAEISFVPPSRKTYEINRVEGSERGKTIVQNLLSAEAAATRKDSPAGVDRRNYDFGLLGEDVSTGHPCWVLQLYPKREDRALLKGRVWVDKQTHLLRQMDGEMAKTPSWWVKRVHVSLTFSDFDGMWLQARTQAVADVRLIGRHTLVGQATNVQSAEQAAAPNPHPVVTLRSSGRSRTASPALGTGVIVRR